MGEPAVPSETDIAELLALARAIVAAVENDEPYPSRMRALDIMRSPSETTYNELRQLEDITFTLAQLVVMLAGGLGPVADAIEMMSRAGAKTRAEASCAVAREWFRATTDNSAEAMRLLAKGFV